VLSAKLLVPLAIAFTISAGTVFALLAYLGVILHLHGSFFRFALVPALLGCVMIDLAYPRVRCSLIRRQTPEQLDGQLPFLVNGLLWGFDTGTIVSTFRASAASWAAILLVAAGWAPRWSGLVYGGTFGTILLVAASLDLMGSRLATVSSERVLASVRAIARPVRWASAALALVAALAALPPTWLP
jgi:hypothetical protein